MTLLNALGELLDPAPSPHPRCSACGNADTLGTELLVQSQILPMHNGYHALCECCAFKLAKLLTELRPGEPAPTGDRCTNCTWHRDHCNAHQLTRNGLRCCPHCTHSQLEPRDCVYVHRS